MSGSQPAGITRERVRGSGVGPPSQYVIKHWGWTIGKTMRTLTGKWSAAEVGAIGEDQRSVDRRAGTQVWSFAQATHADACRLLVRLRERQGAGQEAGHATLRQTYFPPKMDADVIREPRHPVDRRPQPIDMRDADHRTDLTRQIGQTDTAYPRATPKDIQCASCGEHPLYGFAGAGLIMDQLTLTQVCEQQRCPYCDGMLMRPLAGSHVTPRREPLPYGTSFIRDAEVRQLPSTKRRWIPAAESGDFPGSCLQTSMGG